MRNLQAFFNPNPGGLTAEAAAITFKEDSIKPNFLQKKMTYFFRPITKQDLSLHPMKLIARKTQKLCLVL
jgi:hypothetical protein